MIKGALNAEQALQGTIVPRGNDGISPVVAVKPTDGGHKVEITDIHGTHTFIVLHGDNATDAQVVEAVAAYMAENPVAAGATEEEAAQIRKNKEDIEKLQEDKLDAAKLPEAVNGALAQAKASGDFKGEPGEPGADYILTEADKQEIAQQAAGLVEVPEGGGGSSAWAHLSRPTLAEPVAYMSVEIPDGVSELFVQITVPGNDAGLKNSIYAKAWSNVTHLTGNAGEINVGALSASEQTFKALFRKLDNKTDAWMVMSTPYNVNAVAQKYGGKWDDVKGNYFVLSVQYGNDYLPIGTSLILYGR